MSFYTYHQRNPSGHFDESDDLTKYVIIEADNHYQANDKAEEIDIYFDGQEKGIDCSCCSDRWARTTSTQGSTTPELYGMTPQELLDSEQYFRNDKCIVHYKNGSKMIYTSKYYNEEE